MLCSRRGRRPFPRLPAHWAAPAGPSDPGAPVPVLDRRRFLQVSGGATAATLLSESIARAAALPANRRTGTLEDVEHIVVLMQENRSFDHYFGTMRGVRGFGDPHPVMLPTGKPVWHQPDGAGEVMPFRPDMEDLGLVFLEDLPHGWTDTQDAINRGAYDRWIPNKSSTTMAHLRRGDAPFHFALADAFTVCDAYHCSFVGNTDPNRYYQWTGWTGTTGRAAARSSTTTRPATTGPPTPSACRRPGCRGRSTRTWARGSTRSTRGGGPTTPTSATTATTRCSTSTATRTPHPARRSSSGPGPARTSRRRAATSTSCGPTSRPASSRRCRGSRRPRRSPSTRTGRSASAPGTSPRSSTP